MSSNVTLKQIAEALGISAMTVSRALNNRTNVDEKTRQRVFKKARSMGYTPNHVAKSLVSKKTYNIGLVIPKISHAFFAKVISGIEEITHERAYQLILTNSEEDYNREKKALQILRSQRVDGILISCSETTHEFSHFKEVIASGMPLVFFDRCIEDLGVSTVSVTDRKGAREITQHMIDLGHKKIACLRGPDISIGKERYEGFAEAMTCSGLPVNETWVVESGFQEKGGYQAMKKLLELPPDERPEAVVAASDQPAIGAIEAIYEAGLSVPEDIAICGFSDDMRAGVLKCPLTTVYQAADEVGKKAAQKLIKTIENKEEPVENIEVETSLIIRESCGNKLLKKS